MAGTPKVVKTCDRSDKSPSSSGSDSSSTSEEERLRRLFQSCDADGDGLLDGDDFIFMCKELNMEESASEIMQQLGLGQTSQISFEDFIRYRMQVMAEYENTCYLDDTGIDSDTSGIAKQQANITSWPTMSSDSLGAHSGRPDSLDYDSGARDLQSPEPAVTLQRLMESHDPIVVRHIKESSSASSEFLDLANRLHQAALTSLKGEIIELRSRLQHVISERDLLEKELNKAHGEKLTLHEDFEERLEQTTFRYEERITELHSVIAELRKKFERHQISVIREEDEEEEEVDPAVSTKSQDGGSINFNGSQGAILDIGTELNSEELSRVVTELESAIDEKRRKTADVETAGSEDQVEGEDDSVEEKALKVCQDMKDFHLDSPPPSPPPRGLRPAMFHPPPPPPPNEFPDPGYLQEEVNALRSENSTLQEQISRQEMELQKQKIALDTLREERDQFKKRMQGYEGSTSPHVSRTSTPTKSQNVHSSHTERGTGSQSCDQFPVAKVAELKKLKTVSSERQVLGSELSSLVSIGVQNAKVAEHLVQSVQKGSNMSEIIQSADQSGNLSENKVSEFEIELERLQSKIDNLKAQLDLTNLTLEESKAQTNRLSVLIGKYESNNTALSLALNYSDQCLEAYEILSALLESELGIVLANCRVAGFGGIGDRIEDSGEITSLLQRAHHSRRTAENVAKHLLHKLDRNYGLSGTSSIQMPWEDLSLSTSRTASTCSSNISSGDMEFTKPDEKRLRDYIHQLKADRTAVKMTVMELESAFVDPISDMPCKNPDAQRLDLENAVIMQELMAMKEEKAELKAQNYLLEKEKRALELRLSGMESQEQAYLVQIEHLKCEVSEQQQPRQQQTATGTRSSSFKDEDSDTSTGSLSLSEIRSYDSTDLARELTEALKREKRLKSRVQELVSALEKLSRNSEIRHQQSAEFVNDLKRANSALISAFDKAKKKYQSKLKKLESQMQSLTERYETQIRLLKQRLSQQEERTRHGTSETSL
ncbi:hypothetical protein CHS0354_033800 [Potamilus streckersoni]|uniref:EF-hand domain-containing protein n=1 Tax=Potamilus streckersoni TaxID=2493646 RepID=A0AAE0SF31_9BIVA|nr:hypothetical protein CHS0354_033800 [Potamilus streckersoni]